MTDNRPWVEKYRPTQFDDIVLDPLNRKLLKNIVTQNNFPNLLFYGPPGTCLLYTSPSPRDRTRSRMPSSA